METLNTHLGQYDMVLALSENKINSELQQLYLNWDIDHDWNVLTDLTGNHRRSHHDADFKDQKRQWLDQGDGKQLVDLRTRMNELLALLTAGTSDLNAVVEELVEVNKKIKAEEQKPKPPYNLLIESTIRAPRITIIEGKSSELLFSFVLDKGQLSYRNGQRQDSYDISGLVYSFVVPVSKRKIRRDEVNADANLVNAIKEDYTVESILLGFENADVANFAANESKMSTDPELNTWLQLVMSNYFRSLGKDKDNPYILGYAIQRPELAEAEVAMLEPTGVSYSTSFSKQERSSAFNFLMLASDRDFPALPQGGRIDQSLIESVHEKVSSLNGVIAVNYRLFEQTFLARINEVLLRSFCKVVDGLVLNANTNFAGQQFLLTRSSNMQMTISRTDIKSDDLKRSLSINYEMEIKARLHDELKAHFGTVGVNQNFSTSGAYDIDGRTGKKGSLRVELIASSHGTIATTIASGGYSAPIMGRDTEEPEYNNKGLLDKFWLKLSNMTSRVDELEKMYKDNFTTRITEILETMEFPELEDFSDSVILPGSNVYTFKNIRLMSAHMDDNDAVLFDIAYAPTIG